MNGASEEHDQSGTKSTYRKIIAWTVLLMLGFLLLQLARPSHEGFVQPGPLAGSHMGIKECKSCHTAATKNPLQWLELAIDGPTEKDSQLCLNCHSLGDKPLLAHGMRSEQLALLTDALLQQQRLDNKPVVALAQSLGWAPKHGEELQCKSCHQEHSGNSDLLKSSSDAHCQSCHSESFNSFEYGHPEFSNYPFKRRTGIAFDHVSHIGKHFDDDKVADKAPETCLSCHSIDGDGGLMQTKNFENSCIACHDDRIRGEGRAGAAGIEVLMVPGLDLGTLKERKVYIGEWPAYADETLSPFMQLLLRSDRHYAAVTPVLKTVDLMDLTTASDQQLQAVATLAWCVKMLLNDIVNGGANFLRNRLQESTGQTVSDSQLGAMLAALPKAVVSNVTKQWFPRIEQDLHNHMAGIENWTEAAVKNTSLTVKVVTKKNELEVEDDDLFSSDDELWGDDDKGDEPELFATLGGEDWVKVGGWYIDDLILRYRPVGHGDAFVRHWLDLSANVEHAQPLFEQLSKKGAQGNCLQCHSIDKNESGELSVNWFAKNSLRAQANWSREFTHFKHSPHVNLKQEGGCQSCHSLDPKAEYKESFVHNDPLSFSSNFRQMNKAECTQCHQASVDSQSCLSCHNYHIGSMKPVISGDTISGMLIH